MDSSIEVVKVCIAMSIVISVYSNDPFYIYMP